MNTTTAVRQTTTGRQGTPVCRTGTLAAHHPLTGITTIDPLSTLYLRTRGRPGLNLETFKKIFTCVLQSGVELKVKETI